MVPRIRYDIRERVAVPYQTLRAIGILGARYDDCCAAGIGKVHHQVFHVPGRPDAGRIPSRSRSAETTSAGCWRRQSGERRRVCAPN